MSDWFATVYLYTKALIFHNFYVPRSGFLSPLLKKMALRCAIAYELVAIYAFGRKHPFEIGISSGNQASGSRVTALPVPHLG